VSEPRVARGGGAVYPAPRWADKMRQVDYTLFPDVAGKFVDKRSSLLEFAVQMHYILYNKIIPPFGILNLLLQTGEAGRIGEWKPFTISTDEYDELVAELLANPKDRFQKLEPPETVKTIGDWDQWLHVIGY